MNNIGFTAKQCREALQGYLEEIDELMSLVENPTRMTVAQRDEAQALLDNLKSCLKRDVQLRSTAEGAAKMTMLERACFYPAIRQALADFRIKRGSRPSHEWHSALYNMRITLSYPLSNFEGKE